MTFVPTAPQPDAGAIAPQKRTKEKIYDGKMISFDAAKKIIQDRGGTCGQKGRKSLVELVDNLELHDRLKAHYGTNVVRLSSFIRRSRAVVDDDDDEEEDEGDTDAKLQLDTRDELSNDEIDAYLARTVHVWQLHPSDFDDVSSKDENIVELTAFIAAYVPRLRNRDLFKIETNFDGLLDLHSHVSRIFDDPSSSNLFDAGDNLDLGKLLPLLPQIDGASDVSKIRATQDM